LHAVDAQYQMVMITHDGKGADVYGEDP